MNPADLVELLRRGDLGALDESMVADLRVIRRHGPGTARRPALLALLHVGGEKALDPRDRTAMRRLIALKLPYDRPYRIDACSNAWLTVRGGDQPGIMRVLGLTHAEPVTYDLGATLVVHLGHGGPDDSRTWRHVFISPQLNGWTLVSGPSCDPDDEPHVEQWVQELSALYGDAQAYFFDNVGDGDAWLVGTHGRIVRRFTSTDPDSCTGEPLPIEHRTMARLGRSGPPERLDGDDEAWRGFLRQCSAPQVAADLSITAVWAHWPETLQVTGHPLVAWPHADHDVSILQGCCTFEL